MNTAYVQFVEHVFLHVPLVWRDSIQHSTWSWTFNIQHSRELSTFNMVVNFQHSTWSWNTDVIGDLNHESNAMDASRESIPFVCHVRHNHTAILLPGSPKQSSWFCHNKRMDAFWPTAGHFEKEVTSTPLSSKSSQTSTSASPSPSSEATVHWSN